MVSMGRVIKSGDTRIKFKDNFHLKNLYYMMHEWLVQEEWVTRTDKDFPEIWNAQNEAALGGIEAWWTWRPEKLKNKYYKWTLDINTHIILLRNVEIMKDEKKLKTNWGEVEVLLRGRVVCDHLKLWEKHPILKHFEELYSKRIIKHDLTKQRDELRREVYRLQEAIKDFLGMKKSLQEPESQGPFFPRGGIGES